MEARVIASALWALASFSTHGTPLPHIVFHSHLVLRHQHIIGQRRQPAIARKLQPRSYRSVDGDSTSTITVGFSSVS